MTNKKEKGCGKYLGWRHGAGQKAYCGDDDGINFNLCPECQKKEDNQVFKEIAKKIDPDNTFLDECERVVKNRFQKKYNHSSHTKSRSRSFGMKKQEAFDLTSPLPNCENADTEPDNSSKGNLFSGSFNHSREDNVKDLSSIRHTNEKGNINSAMDGSFCLSDEIEKLEEFHEDGTPCLCIKGACVILIKKALKLLEKKKFERFSKFQTTNKKEEVVHWDDIKEIMGDFE